MKVALVFWFKFCGLLSAVAVFVITRIVYESWLVSIGATTLWALFYLVQGTRTYYRLAMPIDAWKVLTRRFPCGKRITSVDADVSGRGALNGHPLVLEVIAREGALSVKVCVVSFLRNNTIAVPWDQIDIQRVGTNPDGDYVAVVSFPKLHNCELVLPWRKKFTKFHDRA